MSEAAVTFYGVKNAGAEKYVTLLEDLEFYFPAWQLKEITELWNDGIHIMDLAKRYKRDVDEVFLALFHQARKGKIKRPIAKHL